MRASWAIAALARSEVGVRGTEGRPADPSATRGFRGMASAFEDELVALDARLEEAQEAAESLVNLLKRVRRADRVGHVSEIVRGLDGLDARLVDAQFAARELSGGWRFDASAYMADGRFLTDLQSAAAEQKLAMFERDGRIYCFPLLLRTDASQSAVRVGRKIERRIRPSELVRLLAKAQKRPQRFREQAFLDLVWRTYRRLVGRDWNGADPGGVIALIDIHDTLTLLPSSDYPQEAFARDLLLFDLRPGLRTRSR